jgi:hypothetical protein
MEGMPMSTNMTEEQRQKAEKNAQKFFAKLAGSNQPSVVLDPLLPFDTERLGDISQTSFADAVSTLASTEGDDSRVGSLQAAGDRRNIGSYIVKAFQKRICGNPEVTEEIKKALAEAQKQGATLTTPTATGITASVATLVTISILTAFGGPIAVVVAPLAGGVALLVMQSGLDGFCEWSARDETEPPAKGGTG